MSYDITVRTTDATNTSFSVIEHGGGYHSSITWTEKDSVWTLVMGGSGTSGALRFKNGSGEQFIVVLGIHNYVRWCDIVTDLAPGDTAAKTQTEYYAGDRGGMLWKQLDQIQKKSAKGTAIDVKYVKQSESGHSFVVDLFIAPDP